MDDILKAPLWQKVLAAVIVAGTVLWSYYNFLYMPKVREINSLRDTLTSMEREIDTIVPKETIIKEGLDIREIVKNELEDLMKKIPTEQEVPFIIDDLLSKVGAGLNVDYKLIQPQPIVAEGNYSRLPLKVNFVSDYTDFNLYLKQLKKLPTTVRIDTLSLNKTVSAPKLVVDMALSAFVMPGAPPLPIENKVVEKRSYLFDPFFRPTELPAGEKGPKGPLFVLEGIWRGRETRAIINDKILSEGGRIDGWELISVGKNEVNLGKEGRTLTIKFEGRK